MPPQIALMTININFPSEDLLKDLNDCLQKLHYFNLKFTNPLLNFLSTDQNTNKIYLFFS